MARSIKVLTPVNFHWRVDRVHGAYFIDNFALCRGDSGWRVFVGAMVEHFYIAGLCVVALVCPGATLLGVDGGCDYIRMLRDLTTRVTGSMPDFIVAVSMGNDLIRRGLRFRGGYDHLLAVGRALLAFRAECSLCSAAMRVVLVYGGSGADMWNYSFGAEYDVAVERVLAMVRDAYDRVTCGYIRGVSTVDAVGHLHASSARSAMRMLIDVAPASIVRARL